MANSQLSKIIAPNINDANFAVSLADSFDTINENFKKIASIPFIQGAQGDSFQTVQYEIWEKNNKGIYTITEKGALLINSIFNITDVTKGDLFSTVQNKISNVVPVIDGTTPIDGYFKNASTPTNNILYFYSVINDNGSILLEFTGQYYYFIDERINHLKNFRDGSLSLDGFVDYSGFYQYVNDSNGERFEKLSIVPSLYYDEINNDICWLFNGNKTGISAVGIPGNDGQNASLKIVAVFTDQDSNNQSTYLNTLPVYGLKEIQAYSEDGAWKTVTPQTTNTNTNANKSQQTPWSSSDNQELIQKSASNTGFVGGQNIGDFIVNQPLIICIYSGTIDINNLIGFSFGQAIKGSDDLWYASWDNSMVFSEFLKASNIYDYLKSLSDISIMSSMTAPKSIGLWIPTKTGDDKDVHMMYNKKDSLIIKRCQNPQTENSATTAQSKLKINGYDVNVNGNSHASTISAGNENNPEFSVDSLGNVTGTVNNVNDVQLGLPIGSITMWAGFIIPDGWLVCDKTYYSINNYSKLFSILSQPDVNGIYPRIGYNLTFEPAVTVKENYKYLQGTDYVVRDPDEITNPQDAADKYNVEQIIANPLLADDKYGSVSKAYLKKIDWGNGGISINGTKAKIMLDWQTGYPPKDDIQSVDFTITEFQLPNLTNGFVSGAGGYNEIVNGQMQSPTKYPDIFTKEEIVTPTPTSIHKKAFKHISLYFIMKYK